MFTKDERRALVFLAATAALGGAVRAVRAGADAPPGAALVAPDLAGGDVQAQGAKARRAVALSRPLQPGERVDVDRADALEIERLPRVGPGLARRIVDDRTARGPFGSLQGLGRVPGLGVGTLQGLARQASFSGVPARPDEPLEPDARLRSGRGGRRAPRQPSVAPMLGAPSAAGAQNPARPVSRRSIPVRLLACPTQPIAINSANADELACLPGIGPGIAARIVTWRTEHGPFAEVKDLERVPGIGPTRLARLLPNARAP